MAGGATALGAQQILNFYLRGVTPTLGATVYLRLLTTPSTKTTSGVESAFGAYARIPLTRALTLFTDPLLTSRSTNVDPIETATALSLDDDIVAFDIVDTASGAFTETYLFGVVQPARSIIVNKPVRFPSGSMIVTA
jgi:hypothetical protein